ncbi:MAG TPA: adenylate/guanylate cyclase domain-containing protein [Methylomirabilota bacterium]|nr:adenylate/guanylate cyclase domain-containing protein [Methylomirabilota bacterium]
MDFAEVLEKVLDLLQRQGRVSYRALKLRFQLDDEFLAGVKEELLFAHAEHVKEEGPGLVWVGASPPPSPVLQVASSQSPTPSTQTPDAAERRQLTVMFCDLVGSTALSGQLDPEELRQVVRNYHETCTEVIRRYDGHIAQHLGDGLLVYFGYPVAHEDDAVRAVRTGLEIVRALQSRARQQAVNAPLPHGRGSNTLHVRIGIHTGLVVIGEMGSSEKREILALGETPNIAARIQGAANRDEVLISAATYRLVEGFFTCEERGQPELKGVTTPLTLYRVVQESEIHSRFEIVARKGLTPLVGREHEFGLLRERWERVKDGAGQVVLLSGEPGIGKSRLVEGLKETVEQEGVRCLELRCSPYHQNSALYPVIEHLQRILQFRPEDTADEKLQKLEVGARRAVPLQAETIPLLAALLSLPYPDRYPPLHLNSQKQKEKTLQALVAWLCAEAKHHAVIYAWEDLHWADPSTLELLTLLLAQAPTTRLLAVCTYRPEFTPPWGAHSYLSQLTLSRLGRGHVETMVENVAGGKALPKEIIHQIVSKTDGVPLFVEELTKSVVEAGGDAGARRTAPLPLGIPSTLQDTLMARLDRLGVAKEIAQLGATLGREFDYVLLQSVSPLNEKALQRGLQRLVEAELVYQSGIPPQARYLFKHALVQDTAYQSLLKSRRQQLHQQVARALEEQFSATVETQPELVAHHYTEAGLIEQALPYWQRAGERAIVRSAYVEAIVHLTKAVELLKTLPASPTRVQHELTLQLALSDAQIPVKGYTAPEVEQTVLRARELCQYLGETPQLVPMLYRLWLFYRNRAELQTARELAEQMLRLARSIQDRYFLSLAHSAFGPTLHALGELTSARTHLEQTIALYDAQQHPRHTTGTADPRVNCLSYVSWTLWTLGYPDQALQRSEEALFLAGGLAHPFSRAYALWMAAWVHLFRREGQLARERAEAVITLSTEQGFPYGLAVGTLAQDLALVEQGQGKEEITQIRHGLFPFAIALLAEAYGKVGRREEGLIMLAQALTLVGKTGEHWYEAEMYRLKGELLRAQEGPKEKTEEVKKCFLQALAVARHQQAKSLELRAATSLARLWQQQGKRDEAHKVLAEVYNWFTEGFDTKDLQEAKALLEELSH